MVTGATLGLDISFNTKALRTICENEEEADRLLGSTVAEYLKHRLADLRAATSIYDLLAGKPQELEKGRKSQGLTIDLGNSSRLVFCANHPHNPHLENGEIDWVKVSRIKILRIERNHV